MHIFIAFVVIVVLIGLGFGRALLYVTLAVVGGIALIILLLMRADSYQAPAQVSYQAPAAPAAQPVAPPVTAPIFWYRYGNVKIGPFLTRQKALENCLSREKNIRRSLACDESTWVEKLLKTPPPRGAVGRSSLSRRYVFRRSAISKRTSTPDVVPASKSFLISS